MLFVQSRYENDALFTPRREHLTIRELVARSRERSCKHEDVCEIVGKQIRRDVDPSSKSARRAMGEWNLTTGIHRRGGTHLDLYHRCVSLPDYVLSSRPVYALVAADRRATVTFVLYETDRSGAYYRLIRDLVRRERGRRKPMLPLEVRLVEELPDDDFTNRQRLYQRAKNGPVTSHPFTRADKLFGDDVRLVIALDEE